MTAEGQTVLDQILALRELEKKTGVYSSRTQRNLLLTVSDANLAEVALQLKSPDAFSTGVRR